MLIQNVQNMAPQLGRVSVDGNLKAADAIKTSPVAAKTEAQQPSDQQLKAAVDNINQAMRQSNKSLELSIDTSTKKPVVKMIDSETGELLRQYPSKEVLAIAQGIDEFLSHQGLLLNKKA